MKYLFFFLTLFFSIKNYAQTDSLSLNKGLVIKDSVLFRTHCSSTLSKKNQPLLVLDGSPLNTDTEREYQKQLNKIDPNDIEKIEVIKGDTPNICAIYGAKGVNGVILITTKNKKKRKN